MMIYKQLQRAGLAALLLLAGCAPNDGAPVSLASSPTAITTEHIEEACPQAQSTVATPVFDENTDATNVEQTILEFLNSGGARQSLVAAFRQDPSFDPEQQLREADLTGDGTPELLVSYLWLFAFGCRNGQYQLMLKEKPGICGFVGCSPRIVHIGDMNLNGIPELIYGRIDAVNLISNTYYHILEWGGHQFRNRVRNINAASCIGPDLHDRVREDELCIEYASGSLCNTGCVQDTDGNGTLEFVLEGVYPGTPDASQQWIRDIYMWDGMYFVFQNSVPSTPSQ